MPKARNMIIDGYKKGTQLQLDKWGIFYIFNGRNPLTKADFVSHQILTEEISKDTISTVGRGLLGSAIFGHAGAAAALTGKENKIYTIRVNWDKTTWEDRDYSILELDGEFYKQFMIDCVRTPEDQKRFDEARIPSKYKYDVEKWLADNNIPSRRDPRAKVWWDSFDDGKHPETNPMLEPYRSINPKYEEYMKAQQQNQEAQQPDNEDNLSKLRELKAMYEEELITQEEYESKRKEIINNL